MASNVSFDIVFDSFRLKATTIIKKLPYIQTCNSVVVFPTFILFPGKPLKVKLLEDWDNNIFILDITPSYSTFSTDTDWSSRFLSINFFLSRPSTDLVYLHRLCFSFRAILTSNSSMLLYISTLKRTDFLPI